MQAPIQVAFKQCAPSAAVRAEIDRQAQKLERYSDRITSCHVVVEAPNVRHRSGNLYRVDVRLAMPDGKAVVVDRMQGERRERRRVDVAVREAFEAAARQLDGCMESLRGEVKVHEPGARGRVSRLVAGRGYGFLETPDGREVYFHRNAVLNDGFDRLAVGAEARFVEQVGVKGPQASSVRLVGRR